jgi:hypothetical protein
MEKNLSLFRYVPYVLRFGGALSAVVMIGVSSVVALASFGASPARGDEGCWSGAARPFTRSARCFLLLYSRHGPSFQSVTLSESNLKRLLSAMDSKASDTWTPSRWSKSNSASSAQKQGAVLEHRRRIKEGPPRLAASFFVGFPSMIGSMSESGTKQTLHTPENSLNPLLSFGSSNVMPCICLAS